MCINNEDFNDLGKGIRTLVNSPFQKITFLPKTALYNGADHTAREIFDCIDTSHFVPLTHITTNIKSINSSTLSVGSTTLNIKATVENNKAINKLQCSISWGIKKFCLEYPRKTIKLSEEALRVLEKSIPTFVRIYGDAYVSKVTLGIRWDATFEFSHLTIDTKRFIESKLESHSTAKGVIDCIYQGDLKQYMMNNKARIVVQMSRIGGGKISLDKQIQNLEDITNLHRKNKLEKDAIMASKNLALEKGKLVLSNLQNEQMNIRSSKKTVHHAIDIDRAKKENDVLEREINHQKIEQLYIIEKLKIANEALLKLKRLKIQELSSENLCSKIFVDKLGSAVMTVDEFIKFYNSTLNDIENINERSDKYSFCPVEYEAAPYYQLVDDPENSEKLLSLFKAVTSGKDIITLIDRCNEDIEKKLNLLQMSEPDPTMRSNNIQNHIKGILNFHCQVNGIKKTFIETACMEQEAEVTEALNRLKKIILELNSLEDNNSFIKIKQNLPALTLSSKHLHQGKNDKKELTEDGRHHWHENAFYIPSFDKNTTGLKIAITGWYWGTLKLGYKNSENIFIELAQIDTKSKDKEIRDNIKADNDEELQKQIKKTLTYNSNKIEDYYIALPTDIRKSILATKVPFTFRHAFKGNTNKPNTVFTVKIFTLAESLLLKYDCIDKYLQNEKVIKNSSFLPMQPKNLKVTTDTISLIRSNINFEHNMLAQELTNIQHISAIGNNCGLFALTLGIKIALQKNPQFKDTVQLPYYFYNFSVESLLSPGNSETLNVGQQLRYFLYNALLNDAQYKEERYNSFLTACCQILERKKPADDINTFIDANHNYIDKLKTNWLNYENIIIKIFHEKKNLYYLNNSKPIDQQLIKKFRELLSQLISKPEKDFEHTLDQYFQMINNKETILIRHITFYHTIESAWKGVHTGEAIQRNKLRNAIEKCYSKLEALIFYSNVFLETTVELNSSLYTSIDYLLHIALLHEINFKEDGIADPIPSDNQVIATVIRLFVEHTLLITNWLRIYINYCDRIKNGTDFLSVDELGCLARAWNINLKIKFGNNRPPYSTVSKGDNLLQITLCNPSQMHWMYEDVPSPDANENTNKKIDEATKEISALISKLNNLELKKRIIEAINEKEAYERREKDFSYITGIISAIIDFPIILKNQKKGSISAADEAIITKLYELFESKGQFKLTAEAIYQLAKPLKDILEQNIKPLLFSPNTKQPQAPPLTTLQANSLTIGKT